MMMQTSTLSCRIKQMHSLKDALISCVYFEALPNIVDGEMTVIIDSSSFGAPMNVVELDVKRMIEGILDA